MGMDKDKKVGTSTGGIGNKYAICGTGHKSNPRSIFIVSNALLKNQQYFSIVSP